MRRVCLLTILFGALTAVPFSPSAALDAFQWQNPTPRGNTFSSLVITDTSAARGMPEITTTENFGVAATFLVGGLELVDVTGFVRLRGDGLAATERVVQIR